MDNIFAYGLTCENDISMVIYVNGVLMDKSDYELKGNTVIFKTDIDVGNVKRIRVWLIRQLRGVYK